ncbi:hypothetical protein EROM_071410 [Encephalitozoon romaleae SJ-2008]|uniref:Uncharacterized protein n=1 Tax=Encephalitozoon romaleae (strain SJ-2008) TaxID=1178016 RepID=I7ASI2_ENCRO|nr:hypothetical protein EROM_071410 [Encephalitozoon romaleae SJ-2008]AFN83392.1 hypothetical protein EROM_071410 [Encephalitozoon romaleae SJ-2008]
MLYDLVIVIVVLVFGFLLSQRKKRRLQKKALLLEPFKNHFEESNGEYLSIHQYILKLSGNPNLKYLCAIITLRRDFCLSYLFGPVPKENFILTGQLKARVPCVYVFRKSLPLRHYGLKYTKKCLLANIPGYKAFGPLEEKHLEFIKKYEVLTFFISYAPLNIEDPADFESLVFLKASLPLLNSTEFIDDFLALFDNVTLESGKKFLEMKQGYKKDIEVLKAKENRSLGEKLASRIREKSKTKRK